MTARHVALYYAWSRPGEIGAPIAVNENRFPTLYESRRLGYPRFQEFSDPVHFDQSIAGFLDHIMKANFKDFIDQATVQTGHRVIEVERVDDVGEQVPLSQAILGGIDTLIIISFDSLRTGQAANSAELAAVRSFLTTRTIWSSSAHIMILAPPNIFRTLIGGEFRKQSFITTGTEAFHRSNASAAWLVRS